MKVKTFEEGRDDPSSPAQSLIGVVRGLDR